MFFLYRYVVFLLACLCMLVACKSSNKQKKEVEIDVRQIQQEDGERMAYPKFAFSKEIHRFGEVAEGEIVVCEFYFTNTGQANLIIQSIESSCGCTAVKWDKSPVKAGAESKITVEFDSKGRQGKQLKVLTLFANTKQKVKELKITAVVK